VTVGRTVRQRRVWHGIDAALGGGGVAPVPDLVTYLVSLWAMEEAGGVRSDSHGLNHMSDINTVTQAVGKVGNAGQFTAANVEQLTVSDSASLSTADIDFAHCAWVYHDSVAASQNILGKNASGAPEGWAYTLAFTSSSGGYYYYKVSNGVTDTNASASTFGAPSTGTWYFIVAWHDSVANTVNIQVNNGTVDSTAHTVGSYDNAADFGIGGQVVAGWSAFMNGRIDQVCFWKNYIPTVADRTWLYNGGAGRSYAELLAYSP